MIMLCACIPSIVQNMTTFVEIVTPVKSRISEDVHINGMVEESIKKDIFVELPLVPDEVFVEIGDYVQAQDVIASVDAKATQAALFKLAESTNLIPTEFMEVMGSINISQQLVEDYVPTDIISPASGIVTAINLLPGAMTYPKSTVCTISKNDMMRVKMSVEEKHAEKIEVGDTVVFKASATEDIKYTGIVERIFPTATTTISGTSQVTVVGMYVKLDGNYSQLKPGYSVNGVIKKYGKEVAMTIPYEAIMQDEENQEYVYVYQDGRAVRANVVTGEEFPDKVEVLEGIEQDAVVIKNAVDVKGDNAIVKNVRG